MLSESARDNWRILTILTRKEKTFAQKEFLFFKKLLTRSKRLSNNFPNPTSPSGNCHGSTTVSLKPFKTFPFLPTIENLHRKRTYNSLCDFVRIEEFYRHENGNVGHSFELFQSLTQNAVKN